MPLEPVLDTLHLFGDATRVRLVTLLARHELTVAELTAVTDLPQSRVSTHLGKLREAGVLRDRKNGSSTHYALNDAAMPAGARKLWTVLQPDLADPLLEADRRRAETLVRARRSADPWPDALAGRMERHYSPGRTWESLARGFLGLVHAGDVLDAGAGDGTIAELLAPRARSITCLDKSARMVAAARRRLAGARNVRCLQGDVHALPFEDGRFDHVLLFHVLSHAEAPERAVAEAARVLRPGGGLTITTLARHRHPDAAAAYAHVNAGFRPAHLRRWLRDAGLTVERCEITSRERRPPHFEVITAFAVRTSSPRRSRRNRHAR